MTASGLQRLETELRQLKVEERPAIIVAIAEANWMQNPCLSVRKSATALPPESAGACVL